MVTDVLTFMRKPNLHLDNEDVEIIKTLIIQVNK